MTNPIQRRSHPRNRFHCFARYRLLDAAPGDLGLLCITKDFSHDGLYFLALNNLIRLRMQLFLKFPYLTDSGPVDRECLVEVVRTQDLYPGRFGVGVRLIGYQGLGKTDSLRVADTAPLKNISVDFFV
jgi:hypothetical protein